LKLALPTEILLVIRKISFLWNSFAAVMVPTLALIATDELSDIVAGVLTASGAVGGFLLLHVQLLNFHGSFNSRLHFFKSSLSVNLLLK